MSNAAIDYEKQNELNNARMQPAGTGGFNVPQNGSADNYNNNDSSTGSNNHEERLRKARLGTMASGAASAYRAISNPFESAIDAGLDKGFEMAENKYGNRKSSKGPYIIAAGAAIFKDLMDLGFVGSLPGVGTVITICASILIGMMLILAGGYKKKGAAVQTIKKFLVLFLGTLTELVFGLNFVPMETLTVAIIYWMTRKEEKQVHKTDEKSESNKSVPEMKTKE